MNTETTGPEKENLTEKDAPERLTTFEMGWLENAHDGTVWEAHYPDDHFVLVTQNDGTEHICEMLGGDPGKEDERARYISALHNALPSLLSMARRTAEAEEKLKAADEDLARLTAKKREFAGPGGAVGALA